MIRCVIFFGQTPDIFSVERIINQSFFFQSQIKFQPFFFPHVKMSSFEKLVPMKKFVKDYIFGSGCTVTVGRLFFLHRLRAATVLLPGITTHG